MGRRRAGLLPHLRMTVSMGSDSSIVPTLPSDLLAARLAQSPAHHQDMCLGVQPGGVLPKDMSALQVPKRKVRIAVEFSLCS